MTDHTKKFSTFYKTCFENELKKYDNLLGAQRAYFVGAYTEAVIRHSFASAEYPTNTEFKNWLSKQPFVKGCMSDFYTHALKFERRLHLKLGKDVQIRKTANLLLDQNITELPNYQSVFVYLIGKDDFKEYYKKIPLISKSDTKRTLTIQLPEKERPKCMEKIISWIENRFL